MLLAARRASPTSDHAASRAGNTFHGIYTYDRIRALLKNETRRIVPRHDPVIWERHPWWIIGGESNQVAELNLTDREKSRRVK